VKDENDVDLFGDDEPAAPVVEKPKPKVEVKAKKPKPIAKTILVFDVKVYEAETNLDELAQKVLGLKIEGLTWNTEYKQLDVAYGIKKLQIGCVIEDDKVMTDDIFDQITAWEDLVQSCDTVSMQKLWSAQCSFKSNKYYHSIDAKWNILQIIFVKASLYKKVLSLS